MIILGIETALDICGVALADEKGIIAEKNTDGKNAHSALIFKQLKDLLYQKNLDIENISGVAVSIGPGSYTGLRIGLAAAKGIAFGLNVPIIGVPTLDTLAVQYTGSVEKVWALLPFRRDELYTCRFKIAENRIEKETDYFIYNTDAFLEKLNVNEQNVLLGKLKQEISDKFEGIDFIKIIPFDQIGLRSGIIAKLGYEKLYRGEKDDIFTLEPLYLRGFPV
ncbi:tRNA (adenosine(37)-N6)-threonylcarbamoyltransferase complex dimerization subunit type 1 TsaB [candidate division KSB1 bacterium]